MGIRGLQTFMRNECENGIEHVSLSEIIQLYRCKTGENPVIIYEMPSSIINLALTSLDPFEVFICGGLKKFKKNTEIFINKFFELGVNLKIVGDGCKRSSKSQFWAEKLNQLVDALEKLYSGKLLDFDLVKGGSLVSYIIVANSTFQTSDKCEFIRGTYGADEYIINYVKKFNCFAVFSNNSSFIISEGAEYCLSAIDFNLDTMTTFNYNRKNLAKHFNISTSQLPVFGSMLLFSSYEYYTHIVRKKEYFKNPTDYRKKVFDKMSELTKKLPSGEEILQKKTSDYQKFLKLNEENLSKWIDGLKYFCGCSEYDISLGISNETWEEILSVAEKRHAKGGIPIIYGILAEQVVFLTPGFSNVLKPMPDTALLPLRQKLYGILFYEYPYTNISLTEYCYEYCKKIKKAKFISRKVKFQRIQHPGLLQMWSQSLSEDIQEEKRRVFCQALDGKLNPNDLKDIEEELLFPFLAIFYLFWKSEKKFSEFEIKILLIQAILVNSLSEEEIAEYSLDINDIDLDAIELSSWFITTVNHLNFLNFACGEPFCWLKTNLINFFDGKVMQHVCKNEKNEQFGAKNVKAWRAEVWEKFTFLRNKLDQIQRKFRIH